MEQNQPTPLSEAAGLVLDDLRHYLSVIEPVIYQTPLDLLSGSTIGQHTRHIVEFYSCLLEQNTSCDVPVINYARRKRDLLIESAPDHALQYIEQISQQVNELNMDKPCILDCEEHGHQNLKVPSTIGREVVYNIEHTIHHLAIIKIALKTSTTIELPEHFGVAPSTIRHRQKACAQ